MSLSASINQGINLARSSLGDLVKSTTLRVMTGKTYVAGKYIKTFKDVPVEVLVDKFSYHEQLLPDYQQTDVKLVLFNTLGTLNPNAEDLMVWIGSEFSVDKADPVYVGSSIPIWMIFLRK
jgi:hypothetical protein